MISEKTLFQPSWQSMAVLRGQLLPSDTSVCDRRLEQRRPHNKPAKELHRSLMALWSCPVVLFGSSVVVHVCGSINKSDHEQR